VRKESKRGELPRLPAVGKERGKDSGRLGGKMGWERYRTLKRGKLKRGHSQRSIILERKSVLSEEKGVTRGRRKQKKFLIRRPTKYSKVFSRCHQNL